MMIADRSSDCSLKDTIRYISSLYPLLHHERTNFLVSNPTWRPFELHSQFNAYLNFNTCFIHEILKKNQTSHLFTFHRAHPANETIMSPIKNKPPASRSRKSNGTIFQTAHRLFRCSCHRTPREVQNNQCKSPSRRYKKPRVNSSLILFIKITRAGHKRDPADYIVRQVDARSMNHEKCSRSVEFGWGKSLLPRRDKRES